MSFLLLSFPLHYNLLFFRKQQEMFHALLQDTEVIRRDSVGYKRRSVGVCNSASALKLLNQPR